MRFPRATYRNIYVKTKRSGERVLESVKEFVEKRLKLKVNEEKSVVDRPWKRKFLGFSFTTHKESRLRLAPKTVKRFKDKIRELTSRRRSQSMQERIQKLNQYLKGWSGSFRIAETPSPFKSLDEWIRRRLRMCLLKQWKKSKTRTKNLVLLGLTREWAGLIAVSRKGYWRLSNTPQINKALGLAYWRDQGLVSLSERYNALRSTS